MKLIVHELRVSGVSSESVKSISDGPFLRRDFRTCNPPMHYLEEEIDIYVPMPAKESRSVRVEIKEIKRSQND